jgi:superfamily II DNA or RNA helicase
MIIEKYFAYYVENYQFISTYRNGFWDGKIYLFKQECGSLLQGLLPALIKLLKSNNIHFKISRKLHKIKLPKLTKEFINDFMAHCVQWDHPLRDYQTISIQRAIQKNKCVISAPTASGKSLIIFMIINILNYYYDNTKTLLIVPTTSLVEQMRTDFLEYSKNTENFDKYIHVIYSGKEKQSNKPIVISTWQSMKNMSSKYFKQFQCLIVDEVHGANEKSKEIEKIISRCYNARFKIGLTGTVSGLALNKMLLRGLFGNIIKPTSTKKLISQGTLSKFTIDILLLKYSNSDRKKVKNMSYIQEMDYVRQHKKRLCFIKKLINRIRSKKNVLILFKNLEYGKKIYNLLKADSTKKVFYIAGDTKVEERERIRKLSETNNSIIIVASMGVFSTGVNIKRLHYIIFAESIKSKIKTLQSIGRVLRTHKSKNKAKLLDIVDEICYKERNNYIFKHCLERVKIYDEEDFNYNIREINI